MADTLTTQGFGQPVDDVRFDGSSRILDMWDKKVKQDISNIITDVDPNRAPFLRFLEMLGTKEQTMNFQFEWMQEDVKSLKGVLDAGSGIIGSAVSTDLQLDAAFPDLFVANDVIKMYAATGEQEIMRIVSKTNATTYVVERNAVDDAVAYPPGIGTGFAAFAAGDELLRLGSSWLENTNSADPDHTIPEHFWNYVQTFKSSVAISGRYDSHEVRGTGNDLQNQLNSRMKTHIEAIEAAFLFGQRAQPSTLSRTYTGGLEYFINQFAPTANTINTVATFNENWLDNASNYFFRFGSKKKMALMSGQTLSKIATFGKDYLRVNDKASIKLGMEVTDYVSPHGTLSLVHSRMLEEINANENMMFVIDPAYVKKRYLTGRDTTLHMNVQENDLDGKKHEILSDVGVEIRLPQAHHVVRNIPNAI